MNFRGIMQILIFTGGFLMLTGCIVTKDDNRSNSFYKTEEGEKISHTSYDRTLELWDTDYDETWVQTDYGETHIIVAGPREAKPVFLFPGLFADAVMWYANAGALAQNYRVYAVDLPVYGGKSRASGIRISDISGYAGWYTALLRHFGYGSAAVAGLSYGSWLSLALAREVPEAVSAVVMLDPSETFTKMRGSMMWKGFKYFMFFPNRTKYKKFFDWMGGGYSDLQSEIWMEHMLDVIEYGSVGMMDVPQHRIYQPEELTMVTMPVLILVGGKPIIYSDPQEFLKAASRALPHAETGLIPGTGHGLNVEKPEAVNRRIVRFLEENY